MLLEMLKNRRIVILSLLIIIACLGLLTTIKWAGDQITARLVAVPTQGTPVLEVQPSDIATEPVLLPENDLSQSADWKNAPVDDCNVPISEYSRSLGLEYKGAVGIWYLESPCMQWWDTTHYQDGQLVQGNIIMAAIINGKWAMSHIPDDGTLTIFDDTQIKLENWVNESEAVWVFYDVRTAEKITFTLDAENRINEQRVRLDILDLIASQTPDNPCNWPSGLSLLPEYLSTRPDAQTVWVEDQWEELSGCEVGYTMIRDQEQVMLVVVKNDIVRKTLIEGLEFPHIMPADKSGNLFFTSMGELVAIDESNNITISMENSELIGKLLNIVGGNLNSVDAYALYQKSLETPLATGTQLEEKMYQRPINDDGEETANIYTIIFSADGKWHTTIIVLDFETGQYSGPFVIDNIREFVSWKTVSSTEIVGYYNDGSSVSFSLNTSSPATPEE